MRPIRTVLSAACLLSLACAAHAQTEAQATTAAAVTSTTATTTAAAPVTSTTATAAAPVAPVALVAEPVLVKQDLHVGTGVEAQPGMTVEVHYTGWLHDPQARNGRGKQFDTSIGRGILRFPLGAGRVIKGWDQGVAGMRVGGKRTLIIPSSLAYGAKGAGRGVIPPNADLIFDVELVGVK